MLLAPAAEAGKIYRWVDAEGNVHLSDRVPTEHARSARSELSETGREVERVQAAKTAEEIAREQELEKLRAEQQRLIEIQHAKDQVLLRTFRTEDDLLMARNGKLAAIDSNIQVIRSNIRRMKNRLAEMQQNAASMERQGQRLSDNLLKDIENTRAQLRDSYTTIIQKEQEKETIRNSASKDLARFRSLKNLREENATRNSTRRRPLRYWIPWWCVRITAPATRPGSRLKSTCVNLPPPGCRCSATALSCPLPR